MTAPITFCDKCQYAVCQCKPTALDKVLGEAQRLLDADTNCLCGLPQCRKCVNGHELSFLRHESFPLLIAVARATKDHICPDVLPEVATSFGECQPCPICIALAALEESCKSSS